ncbi:MAG: aryl-sulfate sulfotransferase [Chitinophagales bacterium]
MKKILLSAFICCFSILLYAQLERVAPLTSVVHNSAALENTNLLISTKDFTSSFSPTSKDSFPTSVQLVSATEPFPPKWYQIGERSLNGGNTYIDFYLDNEIQERTGNLSFGYTIYTGIAPHNVTVGYVSLDSTTLLPVDSIDENSIRIDSLYQAVDLHEYREDGNGNKMFFTMVKTRIDARCLSGNPADSLMPAIVQYIVIIDSLDQIKFIWNPLQHLSPCEMRYEWRNQSTAYSGALNWSHANSLNWANDGNILYSYRHIGVGKINAQTGEIMFKLGGKDTANSIHLPDSIGYSLQHDFYQRPDGKYSIFSNGDDSILPFMEGLIYDIDEVNKTVQLYDRYKPLPACKSRALGGLDTYNNMYFFNKGMNFCSGTRMVDIVNVSDKSTVAEIYSPTLNFSYRAHPTAWNVSKRPVITASNGQLTSDSTVGLSGYTWYKINNLKAVKVGNGLNFSPSTDGKYVVEAKTGSGYFISHLVSDPFDFVITGIRSTSSGNIKLFYNTLANTASIDIKETTGLLRIYNLNGQILNEISLSNNHSEVYFKATTGFYLFEVMTDKSHSTTKVFVQ